MKKNLIAKKLDLIQWITTIEDEELIERLIKFSKHTTEDLVNVDAENEIHDQENSRLKEEAQNMYEKWF